MNHVRFTDIFAKKNIIYTCKFLHNVRNLFALKYLHTQSFALSRRRIYTKLTYRSRLVSSAVGENSLDVVGPSPPP